MTKYRDSKEMAEKHVDWFLKTVRPLLIEHMVHGHKHGYNQAIVDVGEKMNGDKNNKI